MSYDFLKADQVRAKRDSDEAVDRDVLTNDLLFLSAKYLERTAREDVSVSWRVFPRFKPASVRNEATRAELIRVLREIGGYEVEEYNHPAACMGDANDSGILIRKV